MNENGLFSYQQVVSTAFAHRIVVQPILIRLLGSRGIIYRDSVFEGQPDFFRAPIGGLVVFR
jgi:hypothetical protein